METLLKFFPFMPEKNDTGRLVLAIFFYLFVPSIVATILSSLLLFTIALPTIIASLSPIYTIMGIVFAILSYTGTELVKK